MRTRAALLIGVLAAIALATPAAAETTSPVSSVTASASAKWVPALFKCANGRQVLHVGDCVRRGGVVCTWIPPKPSPSATTASPSPSTSSASPSASASSNPPAQDATLMARRQLPVLAQCTGLRARIRVVIRPTGSPTTSPTGSPTASPSVTPTSTASPSTSTSVTATPTGSPSTQDVLYADCDAVRAAGQAPLSDDEPGYRAALDSDGDGIACEADLPADNASDVGALPVTGAGLTGIIAGAGVLLALGVGAVLLARRRRV